MTDLHRAALALGIAASLTASVSALAVEAVKTAAVTAAAPELSTETQQAVELVSNGVAAKPAGDPSCPTVTLAPSGDTRRADGAKATLDGLARDCANLGAETICKIALVGESARKKKKGAAAIDAPMTIQVRDAEGRDVETRRINLKVEMPEGVQKVAFRHVEEGVSLPPAAAGGYADWTIVVGFDPAAEPEAVAVAEEEPAAEAARPTKAKRYAKSRNRYRTTRSRAVDRARRVASRRAAPRQPQPPQPPPVVVTAKPQGQPAPAITTTTSGSAMAKAAQSFTERRDRARETARQAEAARQRPAAQQPAGRGPQPQAAAAQRQATQTAQTN